MGGDAGQVDRGPAVPARVGHQQPLPGLLHVGRGSVEPDRPHQRAAEPGGETQVVQGTGNSVVSCHSVAPHGLAVVLAAEPLLVAVDLDLLLADVFADLALVGDGLGVEADPLLGHGPLVDHDLLLTQGDLVLLLGDGRAAGRRIPVGVGDRLALDPDLLPRHRHGHLLGLGGHLLAQPGPAPLAGLGADPQLLLGTGHGLVGGRPRDIPADGVAVFVGLGPAGAGLGGRPGGRVAAAVLQAVVAPELLLLLLGQVAVRVHVGGVLDPLLLVGHLELVAVGGGLGDGHEGRAGAEQPGVDQGPLRLAGLVVDVDGVDVADAVAVTVDHRPALPAADRVHVYHLPLLRSFVGAPLDAADWSVDPSSPDTALPPRPVSGPAGPGARLPPPHRGRRPPRRP